MTFGGEKTAVIESLRHLADKLEANEVDYVKGEVTVKDGPSGWRHAPRTVGLFVEVVTK